MNRSIRVKTLQITILMAAGAALAVATRPFSGWDSLIQHSPDIIVARCTQTPDPYPAVKDGVLTIFKDGVVPSSLEVALVLKGETHATGTYLHSWVLPRQGEYYLIFSQYLDGFYQAIEPYRIVPLGLEFSTNGIAGKTLDEQVRGLLERRLNALTEQIKNEQEEKQRLEEGLKH
jgi:hypothetical protein